ncbi:MAG: anhydro-N-acetylmuramic acid kinase [Pseudomonadota bacterium]
MDEAYRDRGVQPESGAAPTTSVLDAPGKPVWALGLMSGTSLDGIDAALIRTDGETIHATGASVFFPYAAEELSALRRVMADPLALRDTGAPEAEALLAAAVGEVEEAHARVAAGLIARAPAVEAPALVGFPGQTVAHAPEQGWTWQLGDGAPLARALNRPVVFDFRSADVAAGGEGAPLAPFFHYAALRGAGIDGPVAVLNIGGVANVTLVDPGADDALGGVITAFDTGPGNALINDWMAARVGRALDHNGAAAASGADRASALAQRFETNFVVDFQRRSGPKSLDRNAFNRLPALIAEANTEAGAAALTRFTVDCVAAAERVLQPQPQRWLVCGGGRHNPTMMRWLAEALAAPVDPVEAVGLDGDMLEAQAFAYLAVRVLRGLPTSAPATTGARHPVCGGRLAQP